MEPTYASEVLFNVTQNISTQSTTGDYIYSLEDYIYGYFLEDLLNTILFCITFLLGTPGNMLVIWIAGFKMKTINSVWIMHLAIADIICCVFASSLSAYYFVCYYYDPRLLYMIGYIAGFLSACASVKILTAMSIDRFISVMWPLWFKTHRTSKHVHITAAIIWVMSLILTMNQFFSFSISFRSRPPFEYMLITLLSLCFTIIIACYCLICLKIKKLERPNRSQRSYRVITALIICFFTCWGPFYLYQILKNDLLWEATYVIYEMSFCLACFNSCINPIIYVFIGQDFKATLKDQLPLWIK